MSRPGAAPSSGPGDNTPTEGKIALHDETAFRAGVSVRVGCLALITSRGRVLVLEKGYRSGPARWGLPGGCAQQTSAGGIEEPREACRREVLEETGLQITPRVLLLTHYVPATATVCPGLNLIFDGGEYHETPPIVLPADGEIVSADWVDPDQLHHLDDRTRHRVHAALRTRAAEYSGYLVGSECPAA